MQAASRADVFSSIIGKRIFSCPILESLEDFRTSFHALIGVATRFASKSVFLSAKLFRMSSGISSSRSNADEMVIETCRAYMLPRFSMLQSNLQGQLCLTLSVTRR